MNEEQPPSSSAGRLLRQLSGLFNRQNSKEDLREYLQEAQDNNVIDTEEAAMMTGVLSVFEQRVRDVMLAKTKMVVVSEDMSFDDTVKLVQQSGHSRFPVESDDDIVGIMLAKDLLNYLQKDRQDFSVKDIMRPVYYIPESKPLDAMLREFRLHHIHMAIVSSEYGGVAGLVTIEDVLEEIVGEIDDEHDSEESQNIKKLDNRYFSVNALTEVEDFNEFFHSDVDIYAKDTIGGVVLSHFGYVPKNGEQVEFSDLIFQVEKADERRILELRVSRASTLVEAVDS